MDVESSWTSRILNSSLFITANYSSGFQVLTFEESSKDVQEAEEEIPVAAAEEMLEAEEEEEEKDNKEEKAREEEKEEGEGDDEGGAEELQWILAATVPENLSKVML